MGQIACRTDVVVPISPCNQTLQANTISVHSIIQSGRMLMGWAACANPVTLATRHTPADPMVP